MSKIHTKAYPPGSTKAAMSVRGALDRDTAITFAKQDLEEQIEAAREALAAPEELWRVTYTATADDTGATPGQDGSVLFEADEKAEDRD